jgi:CheY-like chemotaxis protein
VFSRVHPFHAVQDRPELEGAYSDAVLERAMPYVLVVEDDADIRDSLKELLGDEGYEVATAVDGADALTQLAQRTEPCLMVLDLMMPVLDGWQVLERMRKDPSLPHAAVVIASATAPPQSEISPPVVASIRKPLDVPRLLRELETHCPQA